MKIFDFEIINGFPALYYPAVKAVVIADLHLGLESLMSKAGALFPKFQLREILQDLAEIIELKSPEKIIVVGDVKHQFSRTTYGEREEVEHLLNFLAGRVREVLVAKGNHDNFLIYTINQHKNAKLEDYFIFNRTCFLHGHQPASSFPDAQCYVIGHEHPTLALRDEIGVRETLPCFLYGRMKGPYKIRKIVVMPAFSKLSEGSAVNEIPQKELMSPVMRSYVSLKTLIPVGINKDTGPLKFPPLGEL